MTPERHRQVGDLFHAALELGEEERACFLERACAGDRGLRREVESLLALQGRVGDFLEAPALGIAAGLLAADEGDAMAGRTLGRYRVLSLVGAGGMGRVYLAEDTELGRRVALKLLPAHFTNDRSQVQRFRREARAASALNHPNILTVYEVGEVNGAAFIAMEYVEGETLRAKLEGGPFGVAKALDVAAQIADALAAAHGAGIIHRDVKPENVMLRRDGYVKVLDFGLAKLAENMAGPGPIQSAAPTASAFQTNPGVVMGTAEYMSPEQARGTAVDRRADLWSLGVVAYEMVAGLRPFRGETYGDTIVSILERDPEPLRLHSPAAPAELGRIVQKALAKDVEERYQTATEMAADLRRLKKRLEAEEEIGRPAPPTSGVDGQPDTRSGGRRAAETDRQEGRASEGGGPRATSSLGYVVGKIRTNRQGAALLGAILVIALGGIVFSLYNSFRQPRSKAAPFLGAKVTRLTSNGATRLAAVSPDGKFLAYVFDADRQQGLWLRNIATGSDVQILPPLEDGRPGGVTFSPDGNHIYYIVGDTLYQIPLLGGAPKKVIEGVAGRNTPHSITFSPDRKQIAFKRSFPDGDETAIIVTDADGAHERTLLSVKRPLFLVSPPAWAPNGKVIAVSALTASGNQEVLAVQVADGTAAAIPSPRWHYVGQLAWLPDSSALLLIAGGAGTALNKVRYLSYPGGDSRIISDDSNNYESLSLTADGRYLVATRSDQEAHIWVVPEDDTSRARQLTSGFEKYDGVGGLGWLPDDRIVYESNPAGKSEVWAVMADGGDPQRLSDGDAIEKASPDGRYFVTQGGDAGGSGLFRVDLKDGSRKRLTTGTDLYASFSSDGKWVVYTRYSGQVAVWKVPADGGEAIKLTDVSGAALAPVVSPDNQVIAFIWRNNRQGRPSSEIVLVPLGGGDLIKTFAVPIQPLAGRGREPLQWTSDGKAVVYVSFQIGASNVWRQPIDGSPPVQVTKFRDGRIFNFAYSRDGKQLALSRGAFNRDAVLISNPD